MLCTKKYFLEFCFPLNHIRVQDLLLPEGVNYSAITLHKPSSNQRLRIDFGDKVIARQVFFVCRGINLFKRSLKSKPKKKK